MFKTVRILLLILLFASHSLFAQKAKQVQNDGRAGLLLSYRLALQNADGMAARGLVYALIADGADPMAWQDTLAHLYYADRDYLQCVLSGKQVVALAPGNQAVLELVAASEYAMNQYKESLADYEQLFKLSSSAYHAYQIAINQYLLQRFGECGTTIEFLLADEAAAKQKVVIGISEGRVQEVPLKAAAWNLRGVLLRDLGKQVQAEQCFKEALALYPDFALAIANMQTSQEKSKPVEAEPKKK